MEDHVDYDLMQRVMQYYEDNERSVNATALHFQLNRTKVRKILVTLGVIKNRVTDEAGRLRSEGRSIQEIADVLGCSLSTVSTYLPYDKIMYKGQERSMNAIRLENYHQRVKNALAEANKRCTSEEGAEMSESGDDRGMLKDAFGQDVLNRPKCSDVIRLHLELVAADSSDDENDDIALLTKNKSEENEDTGSGNKRIDSETERTESSEDETAEELHRYGGVQYGDHISRDILVPGDLQLWALHYIIQRAFGWQNSHLHRFYLPENRFQAVTGGKVGGWANLVGLVFRSPLMDENAQFWADDYDHGSIKTWLRKKYTGPYYSLCQDESFWYIRRHFKEYQDYAKAENPNAFGLVHSKKAGTTRNLPYVVHWVQMDNKDGTKQWILANCCPESEREEIERRRRFDKATSGRSPWKDAKEEVLPWKDLPLDALNWLYEGSTRDMLERLEVAFVLTMGDQGLPDEGYSIIDEDGCLEDYRAVIDDAQEALEILGSKEDTPVNQPQVGTLTKTLYYEYDFGDGWTVKISGSYNCADLVEGRRITQEELDEANLRVRSTYRPVMIARDGIDLVDDLGGYGMIPCFVRAINGDFTKDNGMYEDKESTIEWAKSLGWSDRNVAMRNRL